MRKRCARRSSRSSRAASSRTIPASLRPTARTTTTSGSGTAASIACIAGSPAAAAPETILLDGDALARDKAYFQLGGASHSRDHRLLAWSADETGSEFYDVRVLDTCDRRGARRHRAGYGRQASCGARTARSFFYVQGRREPSAVAGLPASPRQHPSATTSLIYEEADAGMFVALGATQSQRFAAISIHDHETSEVRLIDLRRSRCSTAHGRTARGRRALRGRASSLARRRDSARHPDQRRRRRGLQDRRPLRSIARARSHWRDLVAHRPGAHDPVDRRVQALAGPPRARGRAAAHRRARSLPTGVEHAIAFDGGGLFARHGCAATSSTPTFCASPIRR